MAVLNNLYWPLTKTTDLTLPKEMVPAKEARFLFHTFVFAIH